jgi:tetratricopeptide (TPR) repeat protein
MVIIEIGATAQHLRDQDGEAWILRGLGADYYDLQRFDDAVECFVQALTIRRATKN